MDRCNICVLLLFSMFGAMLALSIAPPNYQPDQCKEYYRQCGKAVCGAKTCTVYEICCRYGKPYDCYKRTRTVKSCSPFQCLNGGTRVPLRGKRAISSLVPVCEIPPPLCTCPHGYLGRCCQYRDPCTYTKCGYGQVCETQTALCEYGKSCPPTAICVPHDPCKDHKCSYGEVCKTRIVICVKAPCLPQPYCVPRDPCEGVNCGPDQTCKPVVLNCLVPPCPQYECVDNPGLFTFSSHNSSNVSRVLALADPCISTPCLYGTVCKNIGGRGVCVRPGTCPKYSGPITTCQFRPGINCLSDTECQAGEKCCSKGCGRECVKVLLPYKEE